MILLVNQRRDTAYNMTLIQSVSVVDAAITATMIDGGRVCLGRYRTEKRAEEMFKAVLDSLDGVNGIPFGDGLCETCYMPKE